MPTPMPIYDYIGSSSEVYKHPVDDSREWLELHQAARALAAAWTPVDVNAHPEKRKYNAAEACEHAVMSARFGSSWSAVRDEIRAYLKLDAADRVGVVLSERARVVLEQRACTMLHSSPRELRERTVIEVYEAMVRVRRASLGGQSAPLQGVKRGKIRGLSQKSRKRLLEKLAMWRMSRGARLFLHLTYPAEFPEDHKQFKRDLDVLLKRLKRRFPAACGVWKLEFQQRGAPHYHIILCLGERLSERRFRRWLTAAWGAIAHRDDKYQGRYATRADDIENNAHAVAYAAKYTGKPERWAIDETTGEITGDAAEAGVGRWWGSFGDMDTSPYVRFLPDLYTHEAICTGVKQWLELRGAGFARIVGNLAKSTSFTVLNVGAGGAVTKYEDWLYWLETMDRPVEWGDCDTPAVEASAPAWGEKAQEIDWAVLFPE